MVTTNDPKQGSFELIIKFQTSVLKGYRVGSFLFDPKDEINATVKQGEVFTGKIEIINDTDEAVKIEKLDSDRNILDFEIETLEPGKRYTLIMKSRKDLEVGTHAQLIRLKTSNPNQAMLEIAVGLTVEAK